MPKHSAKFVSNQAKLPAKTLTVGLVLDDSLDPPDGVQQYVVTVGEWLRSRGHRVHYLVSTTTRTDLVNVHSLGRNVRVRFNGNRLRIPLPASPADIGAALTRESFDILHVQMPFSPFLAGRVIAAAAPTTAVVGTFHVVPQSPLVAQSSRLLAWWCRRSLRRFDEVMSVSQAAAGYARQSFGIKSSIVPNAITIEPFQQAAPFAKSTGMQTILFLGRLVPRKGCLTLLQAVAQLKQSADDTVPFQVTICGRGPLETTLKAFVRDQKLEQVVTFAGFVSEADKPRYYATADITVFPSRSGESFGIVLLEAMASGKAAILAGDNAGYHELLASCPGDVLFDPRDPAALATRLRSLLHDRDLRQHIATWQAHYAANFNIRRVGPRIEAIYDSALQRRQNMR